MKRYEVTNIGGYEGCDMCESEDGDWVKYEDAKEVCDEAAKIIEDLCACFKIPVPGATLERLKNQSALVN